MRDYTLSGLITALALAFTAGCEGCRSSNSDAPDAPRAATAAGGGASSEFHVSYYSGGEEIGSWDSDRFSASDGKLYFYRPQQAEPYVLSGSYVLEPRADMDNPAKPDDKRVRYKVSLYSDGKLVRTFHAEKYTAGDCKLHMYPPGSKTPTVIGGTFIVEPVANSPPDPTINTRYTVTLHSGGKTVRTWDVTRYTSGAGKLYLYVPGYREPLMVSGNLTVVPK